MQLPERVVRWSVVVAVLTVRVVRVVRVTEARMTEARMTEARMTKARMTKARMRRHGHGRHGLLARGQHAGLAWHHGWHRLPGHHGQHGLYRLYRLHWWHGLLHGLLNVARLKLLWVIGLVPLHLCER